MPLLVATGIFGGSASADGKITRKATTEESIFTFYCFSNVAIKLPDAPLNVAPRLISDFISKLKVLAWSSWKVNRPA
jgi:hypothetical protein